MTHPSQPARASEAPEYVRLSRCRMTREGGPPAPLTGGSSTRSVIFVACKTRGLTSAQQPEQHPYAGRPMRQEQAS